MTTASTAEIESKIRSFLAEELMKDHALHLGLHDLLDLDSLETTEVRAFLAEEFGIEFPENPPDLGTIRTILDFVTSQPEAR